WKEALFGIAVHALGALAETANGAIAEQPELKAIASELIAETVEIAALEGVHLTTRDQSAVWQALDAARPKIGPVLRDLRAGRKTELDFMNGAVAETARRHGKKVPVNESLLHLLSFHERAGRFRAKGSA